MKTVLALLLSAAVGFAAAYFWFGSRPETKTGGVASTDPAASGEGSPGNATSDPRSHVGEVRTIIRTLYTTGTNKLAAQDILDKLIKLNPQAGDESRNQIFRQIIYYLQMLAQMGGEGVPVIRNFLKENKDVDYSGDLINASGERISRGGMSFTSRSITRTDFIVPPSLRLGLVDVLTQIGGEEAIGVLVEMLDTTGRGIEVAYLARVLQDEMPDKYRDNALKSAKDLLSNPPTIDQPNRIDENSRAYLYSVLAMYNDTSFAQTAQAILVTPDGRIDRQAMNYLNATLKEQSVPALCAAYKDPKLTNQTERANVLNALLNFAGPSQQANDLFREVITDENIPAGIRAFTIQSMAGASGREKPSDPQLIEARLQMLRNVRDSFKDERILKSIDDTRAALEQLLAANPAK